MKRVLIGEDILAAKIGSDLVPRIEYIINNTQAQTLHEYERTSGLELIRQESEFQDLIIWNGQERGKLLIWNTGAIGDQLITTSLVKALSEKYPMLSIDVVSDNYTNILWAYGWRKSVRGIRLQPIPVSLKNSYNYRIILDEELRLQTGNCYDIIFDAAGLKAPPDAKPIVSPNNSHELSVYHSLIAPDAEGKIWRTRGHFIVGLHTSSQTRNLPANTMLEFVRSLCENHPRQIIYGLSDDEFGGNISNQLIDLPNYIPAHNRLNLMQIAAICKYATCVISPDSMLVHLAASQDAPCVAIMTTVPPQDRTKTYSYCVPIYNKRACKYESCNYRRGAFDFKLGNISEQAKCFTPQRESCDIASAVTVEDIYAAMNAAIGYKLAHGGFTDIDLPHGS
jgi:ADP-heptose:LPS heptosyltransferase